jgi:adenylate cyclase
VGRASVAATLQALQRPFPGAWRCPDAGDSLWPVAVESQALQVVHRAIYKHPGGAEIDVSVLFADIRGSTAMAERMATEEFSRLLARFYGTAAEVIDDRDGIVDKFVGDAAVALFIPGFAGSEHAAAAIAAARDLLERTGNHRPEPWAPLGIAVHSGRSFVGTVGEGDAKDFTALGDTVNTTARLTDQAGVGEILISADAAIAGKLETTGLDRRTLDLRGREQSVDAWVVKAPTSLPVEARSA